MRFGGNGGRGQLRRSKTNRAKEDQFQFALVHLRMLRRMFPGINNPHEGQKCGYSPGNNKGFFPTEMVNQGTKAFEGGSDPYQGSPNDHPVRQRLLRKREPASDDFSAGRV